MNNLEKLIKILLDELGEKIDIPENESEKFYLYKTLVNIRLPKEIDENYLSLEDEFLQSRLKGNIIDISDSIQKLYDHVSLDIARILYSDAGDRKTAGETTIVDVQSQLNQIQVEIDKAKLAQNNVETELGKQQREYISILGIFAAVVLAFTGGIAFSTSVLNNINTASVYRILVVSLIIGLVLINILFGLFYYVDRLVNGLQENRKKLKPLLFSNIVLCILLIATICAWCYGLVEKRDVRIREENKGIEQTTEAMKQLESE